MINLASSGDEAKIWDIPTFQLLEQFNAHDGVIADLTWNHDGNAIASCCTSDKTVHIRSARSTCSVLTDNFTLPVGSLCLDFNSTSRFLLCGCEDGIFHIWDRKTQTIKKSSSNQKNSITVARWNWNDSYLALGLETGKIILYNVVTGQANSPMSSTSSQSIRQMRYNPFHKSSLATVADDGVVSFWDCNTRRLVHSFSNTHQAPAKDLSFSPLNDQLMVSVGLDKRAVFYDVQSKSPLNTITADQPLTSVVIMPDGATLVVGTSRGNIVVYDMRQSSLPVFTLPAHKTSVKRLCFVRKEDAKTESSVRRQLPTPMANSEGNYTKSLESVNQFNNLNVFSPLREVNMSSNSTIEKSENRSWLLNKSGAGETSNAGLGVFSPLRNDNSVSVNSVHGTSSILANHSFLNQMLSPALNSRSQGLSGNVHNSLNGYSDGLHSGHVSLKGVLSSNLLHDSQQHKSSVEAIIDDFPRHLQVDPSDSRSASTHQPVLSSPVVRKSVSPQEPQLSPRGAKNLTPPRHIKTSPGDKARHDSASSSALTNGLSGSLSPRDHRTRLEDRHLLDSSNHVPDNAAMQTAVSGNLASSSASSSLRHMVQELLGEQLQKHQENLKSEIRAMLGRSDDTDQHKPITLTHRDKPEMFLTDYIQSLVREEMESLKEYIHQDFWSVQVEVIKQAFHLRRQMQAGFAECVINPILLDEIDRLREENARLRKTF